jgi:hypothetical protein
LHARFLTVAALTLVAAEKKMESKIGMYIWESTTGNLDT